MSADRAGGIRHRARIKPPAVNFSVSFTPPPSAPTPFQLKDLGAHATARGFADGDTDCRLPQPTGSCNIWLTAHSNDGSVRIG